MTNYIQKLKRKEPYIDVFYVVDKGLSNSNMNESGKPKNYYVNGEKYGYFSAQKVSNMILKANYDIYDALDTTNPLKNILEFKSVHEIEKRFKDQIPFESIEIIKKVYNELNKKDEKEKEIICNFNIFGSQKESKNDENNEKAQSFKIPICFLPDLLKLVEKNITILASKKKEEKEKVIKEIFDSLFPIMSFSERVALFGNSFFTDQKFSVPKSIFASPAETINPVNKVSDFFRRMDDLASNTSYVCAGDQELHSGFYYGVIHADIEAYLINKQIGEISKEAFNEVAFNFSRIICNFLKAPFGSGQGSSYSPGTKFCVIIKVVGEDYVSHDYYRIALKNNSLYKAEEVVETMLEVSGIDENNGPNTKTIITGYPLLFKRNDDFCTTEQLQNKLYKAILDVKNEMDKE